MNPILAASQVLVILILLAIGGCSPPPPSSAPQDERLSELARHSMDQQARQNEALARQSEAVLGETQRLTEAAQTLVEQDAQARREMAAAQRDLQQEVLRQQATVDSQRDRLEAERQQLAQQRGRDPIIAAAIQGFAGLLACLLPLLLCGYLLYRMTGPHDEEEALGELLVQELTSPRPLVLSGPMMEGPPGLEDRRCTADTPDASFNEAREADEDSPPF